MDSLVYQFQETGIGCAKHSDPECLCDVKPLKAGVPIVKLPRLHDYPASGGNQGLEFIVWASGTLARFEALAGINETELNDALGLWEGRDARSNSHSAAQKVSAVSKCLQAGLTFEQAARWLSIELPLMMDLLYPRERHALILEIEKLMRAGGSATEIAKVTGTTGQYVTGLARRWNVKMPHSGLRYGPEVQAKARELVKSGKSRRAVGREMGISETRVASWCRDLPGRPYVRRKQNG